MTTYTKKLFYLFLTMFLVLGINIHAQNFVNGPNGVINNTGTIILKSNNGEFRNSNTTVGDINNDNGTIEFQGENNVFTDGSGDVDAVPALGYNSTWRVGGLMLYSRATTTQAVQDRWYTNLTMSGGSVATGQKNFPNLLNVYVSEVYTVGGANRNYGTSTFYYDGTSPQTITQENGGSGSTNRYYNLTLQNAGLKTVQAGETVNIENATELQASNTGGMTILGIMNAGTTVSQDAAAPIVLNNAAAEYNLGSDLAEFDGTVTVTLGELNVTGGGNADINGTLALANSADAVLAVSASDVLTIYNSFTNARQERDNMNFNAASTVVYNNASAQNIITTVSGNPYGNLTVEDDGLKSPTNSGGTNNNIYLAGNLDVSGGDINMLATTGTLVMQTHDATATYADDAEVIGSMQRITGATDSYTFNNTNTILDFTDGDKPNDVTFYIDGNDESLQYDEDRDISRKVTLSFNPSAAEFTTTLRVQYKDEDVDYTEASNPIYAQSSLRYFESDASAAEKLSTGETRTVSPSSGVGTTGYVELQGVQSDVGVNPVPNGIGLFASGNDLLLRAGPADFIAINSGRWSNPNTWDEAEEPTSNDNAIILDGIQVHTGFTRSAGDNYTTAEASPTALANEITINESGALIFGQVVAQDVQSPTSDFGMPLAATLTNDGTSTSVGTATADLNTLVTTAPGSYTGRGLIIFEGAKYSVNSLINNGSLHNSGTVEVGD